MSQHAEEAPPPRLTSTQWLICIVAAIGFAFDIYEILVAPLIIRPALLELGQIRPNTPEFLHWRGLLFFIPAVAGGIGGLIGGYLTDYFGRRKVLVWSILLYAFSALAAGFSTSLPMLLFFRCTTFIGVSVEFVAAVAWLAEIFTHPRQREAVLGTTQAFSSVGGLLVTAVYYLLNNMSQSLPPIFGSQDPWRYVLISGLFPALPLIIIRPFLPESPAWAEKKAAGTLRRPQLGELFQPALARTSIVTCLMVAMSYGAAFGAIQQLPGIVPGLPQVVERNRATMREAMPEIAQLPQEARGPAMKQLADAARRPREAQEAAVRAIPQFASLPPETVTAIVQKLPKVGAQVREQTEKSVSSVQFYQEIGGLVGRFLLAWLAVMIASRRNLIRLFQVPGLLLVPLVFLGPGTSNVELLKWGVFAAGLLTVAQFSFWGNYLPRVYPVHLRGTGESFAANIGGRMLGTSFALVTTTVASTLPGTESQQLAYASAGVAGFTYLVGLILSFFLPEPKAGEMAD